MIALLAVLLTAAGVMAARPSPAANPLPPLRGPSGLISCVGAQPLPVNPAPSTEARGTLDLDVVGEAPPHLYQSMAFGDSDHDGLLEMALYIRETVGSNTTFTYRVYETPGGHAYSEVEQGPALIPYGLADADGDGLSDLMGQWSYWLYVYESKGVDQYPNRLAWQSAAMTNVVGYATFADADGDGRTEILHTRNSFGGPCYLMIFENTGNDAYALVYQTLLEPDGAGGPKVVADFDGDGRPEIATSTLNGKVAVFESVGDNSYVESFSTNLGTFNAYAVSLGHDMDGNGKPEFVVGGSSGATGYVTSIYEAAGDNVYVPVQTITIVNGYFGVPFNATGDVDGDGVDELVIEAAYDMYVYKATGVGTYAEIAHVPQPVTIMNGVVCADGDRDGVDEIYWEVEGSLGGPPTLIYEHQVTTSGNEQPPAPETFIACPNPFVHTASLRGADGERIRIYDVAGRLVETLATTGGSRTWNGRDAAGRRLEPGVYLLEAGEGGQAQHAKVVLLHD